MQTQELIDIYNNVPLQGKQVPTKKMDEAATRVAQRFYPMSLSKQNRRDVWQGVQSLYYCDDWSWIVQGGSDWNMNVRFPTLRDVTKSLTDVFMANPPEVVIDPRFKDDEMLVRGKKAYLEGIASSIHEKKVRRKVIEDMFFYGVGFRIPVYMDLEQEYPDPRNTKKMQNICIYKDVASYRADPRDIFIDETANQMHDALKQGARDAIWRETIPYSTFLQKYGDESVFSIKGVTPVSWIEALGTDYLAMNTREIMEKSQANVVKMYHYFNQETDEYTIIANYQTIFQGSLFLTKGTRAIPIVDYMFEKRNDSYWGQSLGELIAPHIYAKDTIFNLEMLNLKLTLQPVLAVSGDFGWNPRVHKLQPGAVWTSGGSLQGRLADHMQPIIAGNSNTRSFEMLQTLKGEMSVTSRTDVNNLQFEGGKTATEVLNQSQSMQSHNDTIEVIAEIESESILYTLWDQQMRVFMDEFTEKDLKRRVKIKNYMVSETPERGARFMEQQGYEDMFHLSKEMIDVECDITVKDKRGDKVAKAEKMGRMMQALPVIGNLAQLDPQIMGTINFSYILEEMISGLDLDPMKAFKDKSQYLDEYQMVREEILLGNKVDVPDETRAQSLERLRWLVAMKENQDLDDSQMLAWQFHLQGTMANITANHIEKMKVKEQMAQMGGMEGMMGRQNVTEAQMAQDVAQQQANMPVNGNQRIQTIPMPGGNPMGAVAQTNNEKDAPQVTNGGPQPKQPPKPPSPNKNQP